MSIKKKVSVVRYRLFLSSLLTQSVVGLAVGSACALLFAIAILGMEDSTLWPMVPVVMVMGALLGSLSAVVQSMTLKTIDAARYVDDQCQLKDSGVTALQFYSEETLDEVRQIQIAKAESQFDTIDPWELKLVQIPRRAASWAGGMIGAVVIIFFCSMFTQKEVEAVLQPLSLAVEQSHELRTDMLKEIEELAEETEDPEIEKLLQELEEKVDELEKDSIDESDLMATLSEMEQAIAEAQDSLNPENADSTLKAFADAIKPSDAMKAAAASLESEDYEKAAEDLKNVDFKQLSDKERRAVSDNLKKMLAKLSPGQKGQLSQSIGELVQGLESKNSSQCKKCMAKIGKACKKTGQCKKAGRCMACQLNRLAQCKSQCRGLCESDRVNKSNSPSLKAGKGASGEPLGDKATKLASQRNEEQLQGAQSEGPSETEITQAPEGEQSASRQYVKKFQKFEKEVEAVLNSEPLPLGHREIVQDYFESIRPSNEEANESESQ